MWKALRALTWLLLAMFAVIVAAGCLLPDRSHVERSITVAVSPSRAFASLNSFKDFHQWSPWKEGDPQIQYRLEGPESGVGAKLSWQSANPKIGKGSQTIVISEPERLIKILLDFGALGTAGSSFTIVPEGAGSRITWGFDAEFGWDLLGRYMGLMLDHRIGPEYEKGLANLRQLLEQQA